MTTVDLCQRCGAVMEILHGEERYDEVVDGPLCPACKRRAEDFDIGFAECEDDRRVF